ncbi:MAG TPA: hypothetical protein VFJ76_02250 [Solirubrobacterales bacterium]|nr:hypothetical protein [Solirubrobacterales bacterium]
MLPVGTLISDFAAGAGLVAACIAVCGFLMQIPPALVKADERSVRAATVVGGIGGLFLAAALIIFAVVIG